MGRSGETIVQMLALVPEQNWSRRLDTGLSGLGRWREWQACISPHWQDQERKYSQMGWRVSKRKRWPSLRVVEFQVPNQLLRDGAQRSLGPCNYRSKGDAEKTPLFGLELLGRPSESSVSPLSGVRREGVEMGWARRDQGVGMLG